MDNVDEVSDESDDFTENQTHMERTDNVDLSYLAGKEVKRSYLI